MSKECVVCSASLEGKQSSAKFCSSRCKHKDWVARNPDKMRAAVISWRERNPEKHREGENRRIARFRANNPLCRVIEGRKRRANLPDENRLYAEERRAALRIVRGIERYGVDFLLPGFKEPDRVIKQREHSRKWKEKTGYKSKTPVKSKAKEALAKHGAEKTAALRLVREIEKKGIEALL